MVGSLATALDVDGAFLFRLALEQYLSREQTARLGDEPTTRLPDDPSREETSRLFDDPSRTDTDRLDEKPTTRLPDEATPHDRRADGTRPLWDDDGR